MAKSLKPRTSARDSEPEATRRSSAKIRSPTSWTDSDPVSTVRAFISILSLIFSYRAVLVATLIVGTMGEPQHDPRPVVKTTIWQSTPAITVVCLISGARLPPQAKHLYITG